MSRSVAIFAHFDPDGIVDENTLDVKLPAGTCGPIVLRLRPADPRVKHDAISEPIGVR